MVISEENLREYNQYIKSTCFLSNLVDKIDDNMNERLQLNEPPLTGVLNEDDAETNDGGLDKSIVGLEYANERTYKIMWHRVIQMMASITGSIIGLYLMFTSAKAATIIFCKNSA